MRAYHPAMSGFSSFLLLLHKKLFVMPMAGLALFAASVGSLGTAFIAEHFFGVEACILCLYQRVPYALAAFLAIVALAVQKRERQARMILGVIALGFFINAGIAVFHSGVELHWWAGTDKCDVNPAVLGGAGTPISREALMAAPRVSCDEINFTFLGFTMANWNILASLGLAVFALLAALGPCVNWGSGCCCRWEPPKKV